jgi:hypothetical protein
MSPQFNFPRGRKITLADQAQSAVGVRVPTLKLPYPRRYSITHGGRNRRMRDQYLLMRIQRPIQGFLVTHRRRFTTGHKHHQAEYR